MLNSLKFFIVTLVLTFSLVSCIKDNAPDPAVNAKDIEITSTPASDAITLSWKPVSGVSWYKISVAKKGETLKEVTTFQDLNNNPITYYKIANLEANTAYDIKLEGTDYLSGGKLIATHSLTVSTLSK